MKKTLNQIRYNYFLDPAGSNQVRFEQLWDEVGSSLLQWYLPGKTDAQRAKAWQQFSAAFSESALSLEEIDQSFEERDPMSVKKAVDHAPSMAQLEKSYGRLGECRFPEDGKRLEDALAFVDQTSNPTIRFNTHFMGELHPHDNMPAFFAKMVAGFTNENAIARCVSPATTYIENKTVGWLADMIGYDYGEQNAEKEGARFLPPGTITSGGTVANLTGLLVARERLRMSMPSGEVEDAVLICSKGAHYSMEKIAKYLDVGSDNVEKVDVDEQGRMDTGALADKIDKLRREGRNILGVVATTGTTECGSIDPVGAIADITEAEGIYLHVDAAYGGGLLTSDAMKPKFEGIERADSVTIDGHKMLYTNYPCGGIVFKDKDSLRFLDQTAAYILDKFEGEVNHGSFTIEGSRPTDGILQLYASVLALGKDGYETIVDHVVGMAQYLADKVDENPVFEKLHDPEMNSLCFQYVPEGWDNLERINELNKQLNQDMYKDGDFYVGGTGDLVFADQPSRWAQRVCIFHPYTETADMDAMLDKLQYLGGEIAAKMETSNGQ